MLWKARLPWWEKLELIVLFSGGIFVMAAGILRCVLIVTVGFLSLDPVLLFFAQLTSQAGANGASQAGSWACRETFVAVVIGNIPMIYPVVRRVARRANGYLISSRRGDQSSLGYPLSDDQNNTDKSAQSRRKKFRHPLSIPGDSMWANTINNDEQMILPTSRQKPPVCSSDAHPWDWDATSQRSQDGIKVIRETIVQSKLKNMG